MRALAVLAQALAMVGDEGDQRAIELAGGPQIGEQLADHCIGIRQLRVVGVVPRGVGLRGARAHADRRDGPTNQGWSRDWGLGTGAWGRRRRRAVAPWSLVPVLPMIRAAGAITSSARRSAPSASRAAFAVPIVVDVEPAIEAEPGVEHNAPTNAPVRIPPTSARWPASECSLPAPKNPFPAEACGGETAVRIRRGDGAQRCGAVGARERAFDTGRSGSVQAEPPSNAPAIDAPSVSIVTSRTLQPRHARLEAGAPRAPATPRRRSTAATNATSWKPGTNDLPRFLGFSELPSIRGHAVSGATPRPRTRAPMDIRDLHRSARSDRHEIFNHRAPSSADQPADRALPETTRGRSSSIHRTALGRVRTANHAWAAAGCAGPLATTCRIAPRVTAPSCVGAPWLASSAVADRITIAENSDPVFESSVPPAPPPSTGSPRSSRPPPRRAARDLVRSSSNVVSSFGTLPSVPSASSRWPMRSMKCATALCSGRSSPPAPLSRRMTMG